jgi:hypothetical protein
MKPQKVIQGCSDGENGLARVVEGGSSLLFGFSKRTDLAKSDPIFQKSVSYI